MSRPSHWARSDEGLFAVLEGWDARVRSFSSLTAFEDRGRDQLLRDTLAVAGALGRLDGERVGLALPNSFAWITVFFGIAAAGGVAVPLPPPEGLAALGSYEARTRLLSEHAGLRRLVVEDKLAARLSGLPAVPVGKLLAADPGRPVAVDPDSPGVIQYTSGSTGTPKGVVLSHRHLVENVLAFGERLGITDDDLTVSWLPMFHDMGLVGHLLGPLALRSSLAFMTPMRFLRKPRLWLDALGSWRGTITTGPNSAWSWTLQHTDSVGGLDFSALKAGMSGAERVDPKLLRRLEAKLEQGGVRPGHLFPVYGLAEATLAVTMPAPGEGWTDKDGVVSVGRALDGFELSLDEGELGAGELVVRGPSVAERYLDDPEATARTFRDGALHTGDLARLDGDLVYVTGRAKDLIVRHGRNIAPEDVELALPPRLRGGAALGIVDEQAGTELLVVAVEQGRRDKTPVAETTAAVRRAVIGAIGAPPDAIVVLPQGTLERTSSGKIKRRRNALLYAEGAWEPLG